MPRPLLVLALLCAVAFASACAGTKPSPDPSPAAAATEADQCTATGNPCGDNMLACCEGLVCRTPKGGWNNFAVCE